MCPSRLRFLMRRTRTLRHAIELLAHSHIICWKAANKVIAHIATWKAMLVQAEPPYLVSPIAGHRILYDSLKAYIIGLYYFSFGMTRCSKHHE